jgi:DNA-binding LacI/PurR family transcriptional regulator
MRLPKILHHLSIVGFDDGLPSVMTTAALEAVDDPEAEDH